MRILLTGIAFLAATPVAAESATSPLQLRFEKLQMTARAGSPAFEVRMVDAGQSLLAQRNDGVVRIPDNWVTPASNTETVDALMLIGLSYATNNPPVPPELSKTTKAVAGVLGFVGRTVAEYEARRAGSGINGYNSLAQPKYNGYDDKPEALNPAQRGLIWAQNAGGCEARIVSGLRKMASKTNADQTQRQDSQQILRALGSAAWTPNDKCTPLAP